MVSVKEFWNSLKISWMRRIHISGSFWKKILENSLSRINISTEIIFNLGNYDLIETGNLLTNIFWKNVFSCTSEMLNNLPFFCPEKFGLMSICGSSFFKVGNVPIKKITFGGKPDLQVLDFLNQDDFSFKPLNEFNNIHGLRLNYLEYHSICQSILSGARQLNYNITLTEKHPCPRQPILINIITSKMKGCKRFYNILVSKSIIHFNLSKIETKWHGEMEGIVGLQTWDSYRSICSNIKFHNNLKWMQYRILHRSLPTNRILCKFVPNKQNICDFCNTETETISHLFVTCQVTRQFLENITEYLSHLNLGIVLTVKKVLFGDIVSESMSFQNLMILYIKGYVWNCKYKKTRPNLNHFKRYVKSYLNTLKLVHTFLNTEHDFFLRWGILYEHLIQEEQEDGEERGDGD